MLMQRELLVQVHGHDFSCVCHLPSTSSGKRLYASGSDEKVIRVLEAPTSFLDTLDFIHGHTQRSRPAEAREVFAIMLHLHPVSSHFPLPHLHQGCSLES